LQPTPVRRQIFFPTLLLVIMHGPDAFALLARLASDADSCERSWSFHGSGCEERVLFFFDHDAERALMLAKAAVALGFPAKAVRGWSRALPGADAIGLAVTRDLRSVRLYVQYWEAVRDRVIGGDPSPTPLYVGFKALGDGRLREDVYICLPAAPRDLFWPPMERALAGVGADPVGAQQVFAALDSASCIYTETLSEARRSWLATVRRAAIDPGQLADCLPARADLADLVAELRAGAPLVHVAGGEDDTKGHFVTLYTEADPQDVAAMFSRPTR
jgi:hypothetical protein